MRSLLFVPGDNERKLEKSLGSGADALIFDLEDSVSTDRKAAARAMTAEFLPSARSVDGPQLCVRINAMDTAHWANDLKALSAVAPHVVVLPKARGGDDVRALASSLDDHGMSDVKILALVTEVPISLLRLETYVGSSSRLVGLTWGGEDLSVELGATANRDPTGAWTAPYQMARNACLITAAAAEAIAIDTVFTNFNDDRGLEHEAIEAARDGFVGKLAIHPRQIDIINTAFTPTQAQIERAQAIRDAFEANGTTGGVVSLDGEMLDAPHLRQANRILERVEKHAS